MPTSNRISFLNRSRRVMYVTVCIFALQLALAAAPPRLETWNTENGLPQNSVQAIAQTPDGYLWIATRDGLARFDGIRFKIFQKSNTPELPTNRLWFIYADDYGRLWIFPEAVPQLVVYEHGAFKAFTRGVDYDFDGVPEMRSEDGASVFTSNGVESVYRDGAFTRRPASGQKRETGIDDSGTIWIDDDKNFYSVKDSVVTRLPRDTPNPLTLGQTKPLAAGVPPSQIAGAAGRIGRTGYVRFGDTFWFFRPRVNKSLQLVRFRDGKLSISNVESLDPIAMIADRGGNILIGQLDHGLMRVDASAMQSDDLSDLADATALPGGGTIAKSVVSLFKDREGNVWVASYDGLHLIRDNPIVNVITQQDGLPSNNVYAVDEDPDGSIWFGVWATPGVVAHYANGRVTTFDLALVTAITHDRSGQLLVGANNSVWKKNGESFELLDATVFGPQGALRDAAAEISFVSEDRSGILWIGGSAGLIKYRDGQVTRYTKADGLPSDTLVAFLETKSGDIWLGTTSGLARFDGERFTSYRSEFVRSLYEDRDGAIWIGTYDSGIIRYKNGEFRAIAAKDGLFSDGVFCILEDDDGWLWMNSNQGIYRARRQDLNDFADGKISTITSAGYGSEDGLLNVEGNGGKQPAGLRSSDGRLWFPTAGGLAVIDPRRVHRDENAPAVLLEEIKVDQKEVGGSPQEIVLAPGQTALEINYTGIKFDNPERLRFRYKLEGLDDNWTEAGTRRTAYFSHLPYGQYTFRVLAANRDGVWNEQGAGVKLLIDRPFYRTYFFYGLVSLLVIGFAGLIYVARVKQLQSIADARELYARQLLESQEHERSRLAMELHDSLGQSLVVIRNRALLGISKQAEDGTMLEQLQEISDASALALQETREIAHTLHPYQIEALGLRTALHSLIDKFENSSEIVFTVEIDERVSDVRHDVAMAVYRIAQEWLTNIVKHSSASEVSVLLKSDGEGLTLDINDNGVGFDPQTVKKGLGLQGIEERSRMIGAILHVTSTVGAGAALNVSVDLR